MRLCANALLLSSYKLQYRNASITLAGFILQGLGYSLLISAATWLYGSALFERMEDNRASQRSYDKGDGLEKHNKKLRRARIFQQLLLQHFNMAAVVLICIGYTDPQSWGAMTNPESPNSEGHVSVLVQVAALLYLLMTVTLGLLSGIQLTRFRSIRSRTIFYTILAALPFATTRCIYVVYLSFSGHPLYDKLAVKVVLQYTMEVLASVVFILSCFLQPQETKCSESPNHSMQCC